MRAPNLNGTLKKVVFLHKTTFIKYFVMSM